MAREAGYSDPCCGGTMTDRKQTLIVGQPASFGVVRGTAYVIPRTDNDLFACPAPAGPPGGLDALRRAATRTREQLARFQRQLEERFEENVAQIFFAHLALLDDPGVMGAIEARVRDGAAARDAIREILAGHSRRFAESPHPAVREKAHDLRDLCRRLLLNLEGRDEDGPDHHGRILIVSDVLPSDMLRYIAQRAAGVILAGGGVTAHIGVLARSLQIPMAVVDPARLEGIETGTPILLDANQGAVLLHPDPETLEAFRGLLEAPAGEAVAEGPAPETRTRDGVRVRLLANVGLISEVSLARRHRAEGVGLYRSEIPFVIRQDFPSEDEQALIYRKILEGMGGAEVSLRALDIGGDKMLSYFPQADQANPFLGLRGIRFLFRNPDIFQRQLRAMLRAGAGRDLRIMFPLVAAVDGFLRAREIVAECAAALAADGIPHQPRPKLGVMVELPAAVGVAEELAAECDFLSIGSNDLVQYMLAVDRTNERVADWYMPWHPAVLRAVHRVVEAGRRHGKPVSLCGDMAKDPQMIPVLVGMGVESLSVPPPALPAVRRAVEAVDAAEARALAGRVLALGRIRDVTAALGIAWNPPSFRRP
jgi:phosphotransferase system enzyme I (PtsP)